MCQGFCNTFSYRHRKRDEHKPAGPFCHFPRGLQSCMPSSMITAPGATLAAERERRKEFKLLTQLIELDEDAWKSVIGA